MNKSCDSAENPKTYPAVWMSILQINALVIHPESGACNEKEAAIDEEEPGDGIHGANVRVVDLGTPETNANKTNAATRSDNAYMSTFRMPKICLTNKIEVATRFDNVFVRPSRRFKFRRNLKLCFSRTEG